MFVSELCIQGYERLKDVTLPLRELTVLIGPNASGKSSVLEVLDLLGRSAEKHLAGFSRLVGGMDRCVSRGSGTTGFGISRRTPLDDTGGAVCYDLRVFPAVGGGYEVREEMSLLSPASEVVGDPVLSADAATCRYHEPPDEPRQFAKPDFLETGLSQAPPLAHRTSGFRRRLAEVFCFGPLDAGYGSTIRRSQPVRPARVPRPDGEEFLAALQTKQEFAGYDTRMWFSPRSRNADHASHCEA